MNILTDFTGLVGKGNYYRDSIFELIEKVYKNGIKRDLFMEQYRKFKVVPSIAEEKKLFREFEDMSGLSAYKAVKKMKMSHNDEMIKM